MMDEPLGALDAEFREHMAEELRALHDRMGATTVYVTHDQLEAMQMGDKIVVMNHGVVEQFGTPQEIYDRPATMFVAEFIGSPPMNFLRFDAQLPAGTASVALGGTDHAIPRLAADASGALAFGVRPEHIHLSGDAPFRARVVATEYLGTTQIITLDTANGPLKARAPAGQVARPGETVGPQLRRPHHHALRCRLRSRPVFRTARGCALMAEVSIISVSKRFGATQATDGVSLTIPDGAFVVLLGPTGAGKTTLLRLIAGLERPDAGDIHIGGRSVVGDTPAQRDVAMVFQQYSLYPHLTVRENLAFPLRSPVLNWPEDRIAAKVAEVASVLRIAHKLDNKATRLSGGEMQRVSIGRALVRNPAIYLMDEPLSSLDAKLRADLRVELKRIHHDLKATLLYVTHDQIEAMTMATHIGVLDQGRLVQFGTPREVYENPVSLYVAQRLGQPRINALPAALFGGAPAGATVIGLRPEHIRQGDDGGRPAQVTRVERLGDQTRLHLALDGHPIITLSDVHTALEPGAMLTIAPESPLYFDAAGHRIAQG